MVRERERFAPVTANEMIVCRRAPRCELRSAKRRRQSELGVALANGFLKFPVTHDNHKFRRATLTALAQKARISAVAHHKGVRAFEFFSRTKRPRALAVRNVTALQSTTTHGASFTSSKSASSSACRLRSNSPVSIIGGLPAPRISTFFVAIVPLLEASIVAPLGCKSLLFSHEGGKSARSELRSVHTSRRD
jgi:hypothetical protein